MLSVGDPEGRDAALSLGAALEGTRLALSQIGMAFKGIDQSEIEGTPTLAVTLEALDKADDLSSVMSARVTWRGGFAPARPSQLKSLDELRKRRKDITIVTSPVEINWLAELNDNASVSFFRNKAYRKELLTWMRLSQRDNNWARDGLNATALGMSRFEAMGAGVVMKSPVFELLDKLGLSTTLISEKKRTLTSCSIILFHRPTGEDPVESGVAFYQILLLLADMGFAAWPMAVLADSSDYRTEVARHYALPQDHRLINAFRVGPLPMGVSPARIRLAPAELITTA
jgi:hypothetical protein